MSQILHNLEYLKESLAFSTVLRAHVKQPFTALEELHLLDSNLPWINRLSRNSFSWKIHPSGASLPIRLSERLFFSLAHIHIFFLPRWHWIIYCMHQNSQVPEIRLHVSLYRMDRPIKPFVTCSHRPPFLCTRALKKLVPQSLSSATESEVLD